MHHIKNKIQTAAYTLLDNSNGQKISHEEKLAAFEKVWQEQVNGLDNKEQLDLLVKTYYDDLLR